MRVQRSRSPVFVPEGYSRLWGRVRQGESYLTGVSVDNLS